MRPVEPLAPSGLITSLPTHDLAATRDFYVRELGLTALSESPGRLLLRVGATVLEFRAHDGLPVDCPDLRLRFQCTDPPALLRRLRALGVEVDEPPAAAADVRFLARDPDGRLLAFVGASQ
jgi:catechol 2,3-dioxygenase-like lactoylglutathione lyase family enzyme